MMTCHRKKAKVSMQQIGIIKIFSSKENMNVVYIKETEIFTVSKFHLDVLQGIEVVAKQRNSADENRCGHHWSRNENKYRQCKSHQTPICGS